MILISYVLPSDSLTATSTSTHLVIARRIVFHVDEIKLNIDFVQRGFSTASESFIFADLI